jgi:hypothetical protein
MVIHFLGDSHGQLPNEEVLPKNGPIIHVGDLGMGFGIDNNSVLPENLKFIRGNHDNPDFCKKHPNYLGEFGFWEDYGLCFAGGAESIDKLDRTEGVNWWRDEELSYSQFGEFIELVHKKKPKIIVSHDAPALLFPRFEKHSATRKNLNYLFEHIHKPDFWIFGHHHFSMRKNVLGTEFICLEINEIISLQIDSL